MAPANTKLMVVVVGGALALAAATATGVCNLADKKRGERKMRRACKNSKKNGDF